MKYYLYIVMTVFLFSSEVIQAQEDAEVLTFEEYLAYVKQYHPLLKQANLTLSAGEANLLRARGGFDPKIEVDYDRKKFKNTEYYDQLNATFKIPTWYGIEFKANFEENSGAFLDPSLTVPEDGLYSAGISFSLAQGFLINERMASLKQARYFLQQSKADRDLLVNNLLYDASLAYFEWLEATNEQQIYSSFLDNAKIRLDAVKRSVEEGDKAAIDSTEAGIALLNRALDLEAASLKKQKAALKVSNYLWINDIPLTLEAAVSPEVPSIELVNSILDIEGITNVELLATTHPKILSLQAKLQGLQVDRNLKRNKLLPKIDLQYNFLSQEYNEIAGFNTANYKAFVNVSFPIFLRKERGDLKLANFKIQDTEYARDATRLTIVNKINAITVEINSLASQDQLIKNIVEDYETLVNAEERKFFMGESSLFLINAREQKLIDAKLKANLVSVKQLMATARLYNALGTSEDTVN